MSWSEDVMASLDARASVLPTSRGDVQVGREGRGPPVLAIHGGPGGFDQALAWCRHLSEGGCEVLAPSRPGYLRTPLQSGSTPESQADLYAAMLDALDIERAAVLAFSSGGPSAVHFAARHPNRTSALFLDTAILLPFTPPINAMQRATFESAFFVWLSHKLVTRRPHWMARLMIAGVSSAPGKQERRADAAWIKSDPARLRSMQEQFASIAPKKHRQAGWINDKANECALAPLPFGAISAPTLIAHGGNDAIVPIDHATAAAAAIRGAELLVVAGGHHILSISRNYHPVAQRQLELALSRPTS